MARCFLSRPLLWNITPPYRKCRFRLWVKAIYRRRSIERCRPDLLGAVRATPWRNPVPAADEKPLEVLPLLPAGELGSASEKTRPAELWTLFIFEMTTLRGGVAGKLWKMPEDALGPCDKRNEAYVGMQSARRISDGKRERPQMECGYSSNCTPLFGQCCYCRGLASTGWVDAIPGY